MARLTHLLDNSVYSRISNPLIAEQVSTLRRQGRIARCGMFHLEALFSARTVPLTHNHLVQAFPLVPTHPADFDRAAEVMLMLAEAGRHRSVGAADLLLAAVAERTDLVILHYDRDFEHIAAITGQKTEAVAPLGSL